MDEFDIEIVNDEDVSLNQIDWVMMADDRLMLMESGDVPHKQYHLDLGNENSFDR
jgi:hypothetical protein